jgi:hypothetical protein
VSVAARTLAVDRVTSRSSTIAPRAGLAMFGGQPFRLRGISE